ncbi:MAG: PTS fructose IIA subunit [Lactobacillus sp.]|jgi:mannose/fructose-specific phosphotransferase system component IIA|nr:PTS fructose IIA subunit [Lactobacillus sp.]
MRRFIVASHGDLAKGMASTIDLFARDQKNITYISAYAKGDLDLDQQLDAALAAIQTEDTAIIFTDIKGGSVNQKIAVKVMDRANIFVIAGFNLPMIMEAILATTPIDQAYVTKLITVGQQAIEQVKVAAPDPKLNDDDSFLN